MNSTGRDPALANVFSARCPYMREDLGLLCGRPEAHLVALSVTEAATVSPGAATGAVVGATAMPKFVGWRRRARVHPAGTRTARPVRPVGPVENDGYVCSLLQFASGARGVLEASRVSVAEQNNFGFEVHGTKGRCSGTSVG